MIKIKLISIIFFSFAILSGCGAQENNKPSFSIYSANETSEIRNEIINTFKYAYDKDITKELPFSIAQGALCFAIGKKDIFEIDRALYNGADINFYYQAIMHSTFRPLSIAIAQGYKSLDKEYYKIFIHLISLGADINNLDNNKDSALILAAKYSNQEVFDYLLNANININYRNSRNENALFYAADRPDIYFVKKLLGFGIEVNVKSIDDQTCLDVALLNQRNKPNEAYQAIVDILKKYGAKTGAELDAETKK